MKNGKISIKPDCGNSSRKLLLKDIIIAYSNGEIDFMAAYTSPLIKWEVIGQKTVSGKEDFLKAALQHKLWNASEIAVDIIITHGQEASVSGTVLSTDGSHYAFCDIYKFKGAGSSFILSITSFIIKL